MLTVWSLCWGDKYPDYYVQRLQREVSKYLTLEHRFVCITERKIEGIETLYPPEPWPGWWGKISLFKGGVSTETNLWLDLDVIITGNLDAMVKHYSGFYFACAKNWAQSGHGGCQSSVMIWRGGKGSHAESTYRTFDPARITWPPVSTPGVLWGDQELITERRDGGYLAVTHFEPELVKSYKYHCRNGLPDGCKVVVFHGDPKPADVSESWFQW